MHEPDPDLGRAPARCTHVITHRFVEFVRSQGWASTTMSALASAAGVSRQTLYNQYGSRESLAEALARPLRSRNPRGSSN